jgi:hypothetical protein
MQALVSFLFNLRKNTQYENIIFALLLPDEKTTTKKTTKLHELNDHKLDTT